VAQPPVVLQANPLQSCAVAAGHTPLPSQVDAGVKLPLALQVAVAHTVVPPYFSQAPLPSQRLVFPQVLGMAGVVPHIPLGSSSPDATGAHVPLGDETVRAILHEVHTSSQGLSQQTLSTQLPDAQSVGLPHTVPLTAPAAPSPRSAAPVSRASRASGVCGRSGVPVSVAPSGTVTGIPESPFEPKTGWGWQDPSTQVLSVAEEQSMTNRRHELVNLNSASTLSLGDRLASAVRLTTLSSLAVPPRTSIVRTSGVLRSGTVTSQVISGAVAALPAGCTGNRRVSILRPAPAIVTSTLSRLSAPSARTVSSRRVSARWQADAESDSNIASAPRTRTPVRVANIASSAGGLI
jgi:hypothetical protein